MSRLEKSPAIISSARFMTWRSRVRASDLQALAGGVSSSLSLSLSGTGLARALVLVLAAGFDDEANAAAAAAEAEAADAALVFAIVLA